MLSHRVGQLVGVFTGVALDTEEMSVTSPLLLNVQPVAGTITTGSGLGKEACVLWRCCNLVI